MNDSFSKSQRPNLPSWLTISWFGNQSTGYGWSSFTGARTPFYGWRGCFDGGYLTATMASRRDFLKLTTAGVASNALGVTTSRYANIMGANDRVRVAICGVRGRGNDHIRGFSRAPAAEIAALCDVDESVSHRRLGDIEKMGLPKPKSYVDVRKLLQDKDIDAISIATPNHWHSLMAIWACQAGKDVYVEKPCSHNWFEGRQLVRAKPSRPASIMTCGPAPLPLSRSRAIAFTTIGTGSGTRGTVKSATRPSTKSISPAGAWVLASRCRCPRWVDISCSTTTRRRPIP